MELIDLNAMKRTTTGNSPARNLRRNGRIPAILYGPHMEPILLSVDTHALDLAVTKSRTRQVMFNLTIEGEEVLVKSAMLMEIQRHPVSRQTLHADFYEIAMDRRIRTKVPVQTHGKCYGVEMGGMLQLVRRELEVLCRPMEIPTVIDLDVTNLDIGDAIHVRAIDLGEKVQIPAEVNFTVVTVLGKAKDAVASETEEGEEAE